MMVRDTRIFEAKSVFIGCGICQLMLVDGPLDQHSYLCTFEESKSVAGKVLYLGYGSDNPRGGKFAMYQVGRMGNAAVFIGIHDSWKDQTETH